MEGKSVVHSFDEKTPKKKSSGPFLVKNSLYVFIAMVILGIGVGFFFATRKTAVVTVTSDTNLAALKPGTVFGSPDTSAFKDSAEGVLKEGGIDGEGAFHLERPGGDSQNVYLTSSVLDLSKLVGKKIKVWGETNSAQKAGWLMDVGRAQIE
ncbi:MAG: hypothetical protein ACM3IJ_03020 [Candidatus Levyibacteriota bacterium]